MLNLVAAYAADPLDPPWLLDTLGLTDAARTTYRRLSGGQQQRLALACALVGRPELVFLDEPTAGMDAHARLLVWELIDALRRDGVTVVLTTHQLKEAEELADRLVIIDHGVTVAAGTPTELMRSRRQRPVAVHRAAAARPVPVGLRPAGGLQGHRGDAGRDTWSRARSTRRCWRPSRRGARRSTCWPPTCASSNAASRMYSSISPAGSCGSDRDRRCTAPLFPAGTFTPDPRPNAVPRMLAAQFGLELKLLLRNGEQLLLTMFIPITLLVGLTLLPFGSFGHNRAATFVPVIMALAVISTAFTGQAIAVAFDRRYGALKRLGRHPAAGLGDHRRQVAGGGHGGVLAGNLVGRHRFCARLATRAGGPALGAAVIALGTAGFAALGLLLGGTLRAEIVLAVANLMWFVFAGLGALTLETNMIPTAVKWAARLTPSGALTEALSQAMTLSVDWFGVVVLAVWGALAALAALRWFRFT